MYPFVGLIYRDCKAQDLGIVVKNNVTYIIKWPKYFNLESHYPPLVTTQYILITSIFCF